MAMGQNPNRTPSEHPSPTTKIGPKTGGEFTYCKTVALVLTHSHIHFSATFTKIPKVEKAKAKSLYRELAIPPGELAVE